MFFMYKFTLFIPFFYPPLVLTRKWLIYISLFFFLSRPGSRKWSLLQLHVPQLKEICIVDIVNSEMFIRSANWPKFRLPVMSITPSFDKLKFITNIGVYIFKNTPVIRVDAKITAFVSLSDEIHNQKRYF